MPYSWDDEHDLDQSDTNGAFSFHDARRSYDDVAVAQQANEARFTFRSPFPSTQADYPLIIGIDTTGSMLTWPRIFFEKLPLLYRETVKYLPNCEISFQAINDFPADGADVALQPAPFGKGAQLDEYIGQLYPVGGGGGQGTESYEIFAAYNSFLRAPNALIKPVAIILGDEAPFANVPAEVASAYGLTEGKPFPSSDAFERLQQVCDVYLVRKPYHSGDVKVVAAWRKIGNLPPERILLINDPRRVVDVILGILGIITGKQELFERELKSRQEPAQVKEVLASLHDLSASRSGLGAPGQRSLTNLPRSPGQKTKVLGSDPQT